MDHGAVSNTYSNQTKGQVTLSGYQAAGSDMALTCGLVLPG